MGGLTACVFDPVSILCTAKDRKARPESLLFSFEMGMTVTKTKKKRSPIRKECILLSDYPTIYGLGVDQRK
jgi:hypothetical protein